MVVTDIAAIAMEGGLVRDKTTEYTGVPSRTLADCPAVNFWRWILGQKQAVAWDLEHWPVRWLLGLQDQRQRYRCPRAKCVLGNKRAFPAT